MKSDDYLSAKEEELNKKKKKSRFLMAMLVIAFLLLLLLQYKLKERSKVEAPKPNTEAVEKDISSLKDSLRIIDSLKKVIQFKKDSLLALDSLNKLALVEENSGNLNQSVGTIKGSGAAIVKSTDSLPPQWEAVPISGRYQNKVSVELKCLEEKCKLEYASAQEFKSYIAPIELTQTTTLMVKATDSVGNVAEGQLEYVITDKDDRCDKGVLIEANGKEFCVDKYEWPNKRGEIPMGSVSQAKAAELCQSVGKSLCSLDQWQTACKVSDKGSNKYSYGNKYQRFCVTNSKVAGRSGYKKNCRSWSGAYDMSGNLWEWTSTKDKKLKTRFLVAGGNHASKNATMCSEKTYSFFPQNEYTGVGFRCCAQPK